MQTENANCKYRTYMYINFLPENMENACKNLYMGVHVLTEKSWLSWVTSLRSSCPLLAVTSHDVCKH